MYWKKWGIGLLILGVSVLGGCHEGIDAVEYNNQLVETNKLVYDTYDNYITYSQESDVNDVDKIEKHRRETIDEIEKYRLLVEKVGDYRNDSLLFDAFLENIDNILHILHNEEKQLVDLWNKIDNYPKERRKEDIETQFANKETELIGAINKQIDSGDTKLKNVQQAFATKYHFETQ